MVTVKVGVRLAIVFALVLAALASDAAVGAATSATAPVVATARVRIINMNGTTCTSFFCYKPTKLSINAGTTVTWINTTGVSHTVTRCTVTACGVGGGSGIAPGFGSGTIGPTGSYSYTFTHKGTYVYYCAIHGYSIMHARVIEVT